MSSASSIRLVAASIAALLAASVGPAAAEMAKPEDDDNTRAVKVIEAPSDTPAPPSGPSLAPPTIALPPAPAALPPSPLPPSATAPFVPEPGAPSGDLGPPQRPAAIPVPRKQTALGAIPIDTKAANPAELSVELLPGVDVALGTKVSFRVTSKKPGYLILVDVDADGRLTQIFPAPNNVVGARAQRAPSNYVTPGKPLHIPTSGDSVAGIEYVAAPPTGVAMVVAILSDKPVQIIDLPDVPTALTGQAEALAFLTKLAKELRIPAGGRLQEAHWSFDAKFYAIR
jgi:hypothetical protein